MIAVIAGTGTLPLEACKRFLEQGSQFFVIVLFPENNLDELRSVVKDNAELIVQDVYQAGALFELLKKKYAHSVLMIGKVEKNLLLKKARLDWLAIKILGSLVFRSDRDILERVVAEFENNNITVLKQNEILGGLLVKPGILTGFVTPDLEKDIAFGLETARAIAHANIGQTVVVKDRMVLAIEAIEGTDACIKRGIELGHNNVVICKVARIDQNKKYDLPTLGPASLAHLKPGDVAAIAWDAQHTLIANKEQFIAQASERNITLVGY